MSQETSLSCVLDFKLYFTFSRRTSHLDVNNEVHTGMVSYDDDRSTFLNEALDPKWPSLSHLLYGN